MRDRPTRIGPARPFGFAVNFAFIMGGFCLLIALSWPILMSYDWWVFKDRSAFLNLDYLFFTRHYRLGVDVGYSYGLLPVLLQHLAVLPFGRSFKPMIGCTFAVMILFALFWAALLEHLPRQRRWLVAVVALSQILLIVNPNFPYSLVVLSILFALLFVLKKRLDLALAVSVIGCLSVPSLPLILAAMIALSIVASWWSKPDRSLRSLAMLLAPGVLTYAALATVLVLVFGFASFAATATPLAGTRFYKAVGFSGFDAFLVFLHPPGYGMKYYLAYYVGSPVTWFVLCSFFVVVVAVVALAPLLHGRRIGHRGLFVSLVCILQLVFVLVAYGQRGQHSLYEPVLAAGTLVGISMLSREKLRDQALLLYIVVGVAAELGPIYKTLNTWRTTSPDASAFGMYTYPEASREWADILRSSKTRKTLLITYGTGQHLYYSSVQNPDAWFMISGLLLPSQKQAILNQMKQADVIVADVVNETQVPNDPDIHAELAKMHETKSSDYFRVWEKKPAP